MRIEPEFPDGDQYLDTRTSRIVYVWSYGDPGGELVPRDRA
jgi:hypothetical protein